MSAARNTKAALEKGDIDIALLFSSDGAIAKNGWVALEDDKDLQPVDNFIPAVRTDVGHARGRPRCSTRCRPPSTVEDMQQLVAAVSIDGENPADVAGDVPGGRHAARRGRRRQTSWSGRPTSPSRRSPAELYAQALEAAGASVEKKLQFGARDAYFPALVER